MMAARQPAAMQLRMFAWCMAARQPPSIYKRLGCLAASCDAASCAYATHTHTRLFSIPLTPQKYSAALNNHLETAIPLGMPAGGLSHIHVLQPPTFHWA